jgi:hypothetical protein
MLLFPQVPVGGGLQERERMPRDLKALERHGLAPAPPPGPV